MNTPRRPRAFTPDVWTTVDSRFDSTFDHFDELFEKISGGTITAPAKTNYPPYNIIQWYDSMVELQVATAGFSLDEIDVTILGNRLTVKGSKTPKNGPNVEYKHRGVAMRDFTLEFNLGDHMELVNSSYFDGLLKLVFNKNVPEALTPKKVTIANTANVSYGVQPTPETKKEEKEDLQLLTEETGIPIKDWPARPKSDEIEDQKYNDLRGDK